MTLVFFTDRDLGTAFPQVLKAAGLAVERHRDHFVPDASDQHWLSEVGRRGWVALTHDTRIRYKPNELAGRCPSRALDRDRRQGAIPALARSFVATREPVERFLRDHGAPLIAKLYRASPAELAADPDARGRIEKWYPR